MTAFGGSWPPTFANGISNTSQIVGQNSAYGTPLTIFLGHATSWKNGVATDLGTLGGTADLGYPTGYSSAANGVNDFGLIVGWSTTTPIDGFYFFGWDGSVPVHAILWTPAGEMHDLGALPGDTFSAASKISFYGQAIGVSGNTVAAPIYSGPDYDPRYAIIGRPFTWSESGGITDLNTLILPDSGWVLNAASDINAWGEIVGEGTLNGEPHGFLLNPIYQASVQPPVNVDGSSAFNAKRGVIPVRFTLTQYKRPTCSLPPAKINVSRIAGGTFGSIEESNSDVEISGCQYHYNLAAFQLGVGTYRIDISIQGIMVGHAVTLLELEDLTTINDEDGIGSAETSVFWGGCCRFRCS